MWTEAQAAIIRGRIRSGKCWNCGQPKSQCVGWWNTVLQMNLLCPETPKEFLEQGGV